MNAQDRRILFYSDTTSADVHLLQKQLSDIGYDDATRLEDRDQLIGSCNDSHQQTLVILLTSRAPDQAALLDLLHRSKSMPVLGLFSENFSVYGKPVFNACNEVAIWPCSSQELGFRIEKMGRLNTDNPSLGRNLYVQMNILGNSPAFVSVLDNVSKIIKCDAPVYIDGETGTGKELIARAIHYLSERSDCPFIAANCGAIPDQLIENELFGHDKGAYTDAREPSDGLIAQAEGGTLFLDEIETLSAKGQVVLLRFLENMVYRPLGSKASRTANLRIVTATNENISRLVERGGFRRDLFYRINIMNVLLPPLRERKGDVKLLAQHFIRQFQTQYGQPEKELHPDSLKALKYYDWPGNVRELENMLHREFLLAEGSQVCLSEIEATKRERRLECCDRRQKNLFGKTLVKAKKAVVTDFEHRYLSLALDKAKGNISEAARLAGKERRSFTRLLEKYRLNRSHFKTH